MGAMQYPQDWRWLALTNSWRKRIALRVASTDSSGKPGWHSASACALLGRDTQACFRFFRRFWRIEISSRLICSIAFL